MVLHKVRCIVQLYVFAAAETVDPKRAAPCWWAYRVLPCLPVSVTYGKRIEVLLR
jgi:hypothetical protein